MRLQTSSSAVSLIRGSEQECFFLFLFKALFKTGHERSIQTCDGLKRFHLRKYCILLYLCCELSVICILVKEKFSICLSVFTFALKSTSPGQPMPANGRDRVALLQGLSPLFRSWLPSLANAACFAWRLDSRLIVIFKHPKSNAAA